MSGKVIFPEFEVAHRISEVERAIGNSVVSHGEIDHIIHSVQEGLYRDPTSLLLQEQQTRITSCIRKMQDCEIDTQVDSLCKKTQKLARKKRFSSNDFKEAKHLSTQMDALFEHYRCSKDHLKQIAKARVALSQMGIDNERIDPNPINFQITLPKHVVMTAAIELMEMGGSLYQGRSNQFFEMFNQLHEEIKQLFLKHIDRRGANLALLNDTAISPLHRENIDAVLQATVRTARHLTAAEDPQEYLSKDDVIQLFKEAEEIERLFP